MVPKYILGNFNTKSRKIAGKIENYNILKLVKMQKLIGFAVDERMNTRNTHLQYNRFYKWVSPSGLTLTR